MRPIKFRAWDKIESKMWFPDALRFDLGHPSLAMKYHALTWFTFHEHEGLHDPIMQFTGLHDRNGKEIYEGDILRTDHTNIGEVIWTGNHFGVGFSIMENGGIVYYEDDWQEFEVIGNIYENSELIKE